MKITRKRCFIVGICMLGAFVLWTVLVSFSDVRAIGPEGSLVGLAGINGYVRDIVGVNWFMYAITDWLGLVPVAVCVGFAVFGLIQLIKRKKLVLVDRDILVLGGFYLAVMAVYILFEFVVINRRPVLIEGYLEASYPSSTTMLTLCVMLTAIIQLKARIKNKAFRRAVICAIAAFAAFMVIGRIISGVHWITDIIGGVLISGGLVSLYRAFNGE